VVLRPLTAADVEATGPVPADPDVLALTGSVHTTEEAYELSPVLDQATWAWYTTRDEQNDRLDLAVVDADTDVCCRCQESTAAGSEGWRAGAVALWRRSDPVGACSTGDHGRQSRALRALTPALKRPRWSDCSPLLKSGAVDF